MLLQVLGNLFNNANQILDDVIVMT